MGKMQSKATSKTPRLSGRDKALLTAFLSFHRDAFTRAFLSAREGHRAAPGLTAYFGQMEYRRNGLGALDYMMAHLNDRQRWLTAFQVTESPAEGA